MISTLLFLLILLQSFPELLAIILQLDTNVLDDIFKGMRAIKKHYENKVLEGKALIDLETLWKYISENTEYLKANNVITKTQKTLFDLVSKPQKEITIKVVKEVFAEGVLGLSPKINKPFKTVESLSAEELKKYNILKEFLNSIPANKIIDPTPLNVLDLPGKLNNPTPAQIESSIEKWLSTTSNLYIKIAIEHIAANYLSESTYEALCKEHKKNTLLTELWYHKKTCIDQVVGYVSNIDRYIDALRQEKKKSILIINTSSDEKTKKRIISKELAKIFASDKQKYDVNDLIINLRALTFKNILLTENKAIVPEIGRPIFSIFDKLLIVYVQDMTNSQDFKNAFNLDYNLFKQELTNSITSVKPIPETIRNQIIGFYNQWFSTGQKPQTEFPDISVYKYLITDKKGVPLITEGGQYYTGIDIKPMVNVADREVAGEITRAIKFVNKPLLPNLGDRKLSLNQIIVGNDDLVPTAIKTSIGQLVENYNEARYESMHAVLKKLHKLLKKEFCTQRSSRDPFNLRYTCISIDSEYQDYDKDDLFEDKEFLEINEYNLEAESEPLLAQENPLSTHKTTISLIQQLWLLMTISELVKNQGKPDKLLMDISSIILPTSVERLLGEGVQEFKQVALPKIIASIKTIAATTSNKESVKLATTLARELLGNNPLLEASSNIVGELANIIITSTTLDSEDKVNAIFGGTVITINAANILSLALTAEMIPFVNEAIIVIGVGQLIYNDVKQVINFNKQLHLTPLEIIKTLLTAPFGHVAETLQDDLKAKAIWSQWLDKFSPLLKDNIALNTTYDYIIPPTIPVIQITNQISERCTLIRFGERICVSKNLNSADIIIPNKEKAKVILQSLDTPVNNRLFDTPVNTTIICAPKDKDVKVTVTKRILSEEQNSLMGPITTITEKIHTVSLPSSPIPDSINNNYCSNKIVLAKNKISKLGPSKLLLIATNNGDDVVNLSNVVVTHITIILHPNINFEVPFNIIFNEAISTDLFFHLPSDGALILRKPGNTVIQANLEKNSQASIIKHTHDALLIHFTANLLDLKRICFFPTNAPTILKVELEGNKQILCDHLCRNTTLSFQDGFIVELGKPTNQGKIDDVYITLQHPDLYQYLDIIKQLFDKFTFTYALITNTSDTYLLATNKKINLINTTPYEYNILYLKTPTEVKIKINTPSSITVHASGPILLDAKTISDIHINEIKKRSEVLNKVEREVIYIYYKADNHTKVWGIKVFYQQQIPDVKIIVSNTQSYDYNHPNGRTEIYLEPHNNVTIASEKLIEAKNQIMFNPSVNSNNAIFVSQGQNLIVLFPKIRSFVVIENGIKLITDDRLIHHACSHAQVEEANLALADAIIDSINCHMASLSNFTLHFADKVMKGEELYEILNIETAHNQLLIEFLKQIRVIQLILGEAIEIDLENIILPLSLNYPEPCQNATIEVKHTNNSKIIIKIHGAENNTIVAFSNLSEKNVTLGCKDIVFSICSNTNAQDIIDSQQASTNSDQENINAQIKSRTRRTEKSDSFLGFFNDHVPSSAIAPSSIVINFTNRIIIKLLAVDLLIKPLDNTLKWFTNEPRSSCSSSGELNCVPLKKIYESISCKTANNNAGSCHYFQFDSSHCIQSIIDNSIYCNKIKFTQHFCQFMAHPATTNFSTSFDYIPAHNVTCSEPYKLEYPGRGFANSDILIKHLNRRTNFETPFPAFFASDSFWTILFYVIAYVSYKGNKNTEEKKINLPKSQQKEWSKSLNDLDKSLKGRKKLLELKKVLAQESEQEKEKEHNPCAWWKSLKRYFQDILFESGNQKLEKIGQSIKWVKLLQKILNDLKCELKEALLKSNISESFEMRIDDLTLLIHDNIPLDCVDI